MQNIPDDKDKKPKQKDYLRELINDRQAKSALNSPMSNGGSLNSKFNSYH